MSQSKCDEPDQMLDAFIYDYLMKKQLYQTARIFHNEGNVAQDIAMDAPGGFLFEWWSIFWELYMAKRGLSQSELAVSYLKAQEMRKQEEQERIHCVLQIPAQQQQYGAETQVVKGNVHCPINNNHLVRQNPVTSITRTTVPNEDKLKSPLQGNALDDMTIKIMKAKNSGQFPPEDYAQILDAITGGQASGQTLLGAPNILQGNLQHDQNQNQQHQGSTQGMNSDTSALMGFRAGASEGPFNSVHGSNQNGNDLTLQRRPLAGLDKLHEELLQKYNLMLLSQSSNQNLPQQQHKLQAGPVVNCFARKRSRVRFNNQIMVPGKDGQSNSVGGSIPNIVTSAQIGFPEFPFLDLDMLLKECEFKDTISQVERKQRRKLGSNPGLSNSSGTANTMGSSTGSPSTPSMQTPLPTLQQNDLISLASTQNQLVDTDHLKSDGSLGDNFGSFSYLADTDHKGRVDKGFSFNEIKHGMASSHKVNCCHFSSDGKLLVTGGHDKKASLWSTELFNRKSTLEEHTQSITDVRFSPSMMCVATSSADKTVKVWDVNNPSHSLRTFTGNTTVMSLDFHPSKDDLFCTCDNKEIRYWSIENGSSVGVVFKGRVTQVRFQPGSGKLLAAAVNDLALIVDTETPRCILKQQDLKSPVRSVCWDSSGKYLASVSDNLVKIWDVGSDGSATCIHKLDATGTNKFKTCAFHPIYHVLVIGCNETLALWDYLENKIMIKDAHEKLVSDVAVSDVTGLVASVSHDKHFKIWK